MKYKIYPAIFIICLLTLITVFGGITGSHEDCPDVHRMNEYTIREADFLEPIANGSIVQFRVDELRTCTIMQYDDCDGRCEAYDYLDQDHYSVSVGVQPDFGLISTINNYDLVYNSSEEMFISSAIELTPGKYNLYYEIKCAADSSYMYETTFEATTGLDGTYNMTSYNAYCTATGKSYTFGTDTFTGTNQLKISRLAYSLSINVSGSFNEDEIPCISQSYSESHSGNFRYFADQNLMRISHNENGTTVYQDFSISGDPESSMSISSTDDDGNTYSMNFTKAE